MMEIKKIVKLDTNVILKDELPYCHYLEMWNPSVEEILELVPFLEKNQYFLYIWLFGEMNSIPDYSELDHDRIYKPYYLGTCRKDAHAAYLQIRENVFYHMYDCDSGWRTPIKINVDY